MVQHGKMGVNAGKGPGVLGFACHKGAFFIDFWYCFS